MAGYDVNITIDPKFHKDGKKFFGFLQNVARKYSVNLRYRTVKSGKYYVTVDGTPGAKIDALFQELILNKGLYYYVCTIKDQNKRKIVSKAIVPIYQDLLESRFENPYSSFVRRHILGKVSQNKFIPGDLMNEHSHEFEVIFRKWDLGIISDWDFIKDTDALLTKFLLIQIGHKPGKRSKKFYSILDKAQSKGIGMADETKTTLQKVHDTRTLGLHRLKRSMRKKDITNLAIQLFNYFQYFDEFTQSQQRKTEKLHGRKYHRIRYGYEDWRDENDEPYKDENGIPYDNEKLAKERPCHDCEAIYGQFHCDGCDMEQCPRCKGQYLSCDCKLESDWD